jgi:hypothetical protein
MRHKKDLYQRINGTIVKYGKNRGGVDDIEIVGVLAEIIADVLVLQDPETQAAMRKLVDWCVDKKIAIHREHEVGTQPQRLHS